MRVRKLVMAVVIATALALPFPVSSQSATPARSCSGAVVRQTSVAALRANFVRVRNLTCAQGRALLRGFLTEVIKDADCLQAAQFGGGGCLYRSYLCFRANIGVAKSNSCVVSGGREVLWRERDEDVSGGT